MELTRRNRPTGAAKNDGGEGRTDSDIALGRGTGGTGRDVSTQPEVGKGRSGGKEPAQNKVSEVAPKTVEVVAPLTAEQVLTNIGTEFNNIRQTDKVRAWRVYQRRLMQNFGKLIEVMSPKDITELCMKIEENLKSESGGGQLSPLDECREFLNGPKIKGRAGVN